MSGLLKREELLVWLRSQATELEADRDRAANADNWGKAAQKEGERLGILKVVSRIELNEFSA